MKVVRENPGDFGAETSFTAGKDVRDEMAEAVTLYRSAMRHVAEKQAERPFVPAARRISPLRMRMVLVPALGAAMAAAVIAPTLAHLHHPASTPVKVAADGTATAATVAKVDDAQLMSQIDSDLTQDVPDALQPLTGWDDTSATTAKTAGTEK